MTTDTELHATRAAEQDHLFTLDPTRVYPVLERADGVHVWDTDGNQYLDAVSGTNGVALVGRTEPASRLAGRYDVDLTGDATVVFDLRRGREPRPRVTARIGAYLDEAEKAGTG